MKELSATALTEGMVLAKDISNDQGVIFAAGTKLMDAQILHLKQSFAGFVWVKEEHELACFDRLNEQGRKSVDNMLQAIFRYNKDSRHPLVHYMLAIRREELAKEYLERRKS